MFAALLLCPPNPTWSIQASTQPPMHCIFARSYISVDSYPEDASIQDRLSQPARRRIQLGSLSTRTIPSPTVRRFHGMSVRVPSSIGLFCPPSLVTSCSSSTSANSNLSSIATASSSGSESIGVVYHEDDFPYAHTAIATRNHDLCESFLPYGRCRNCQLRHVPSPQWLRSPAAALRLCKHVSIIYVHDMSGTYSARSSPNIFIIS